MVRWLTISIVRICFYTTLRTWSDLSAYTVKAFVSENDIGHLNLGEIVSVQINHPLSFMEGRILNISPYTSEHLIYPTLASTNFGPLPVVEKSYGKLSLTESYYVVMVEIIRKDDELSIPLRIGQTAQVTIRGPWKSKAAELFRRVTQTLIRESSF